MNDTWIPMTERRPDKAICYYLVSRRRSVMIALWTCNWRDGWHWEYEEGNTMLGVDAWMELPRPFINE